MRWLVVAFVLAVAIPAPGAETAAGVYHAACAGCHGRDGRGAPPDQLGFDTPVPDFTDCSFATREPDADWLAISHRGGPVRAFDRMMPAFGAALAVEDLQKALDHVRTFCSDRSWPRGELNLPRALFTEKAYPEDEAVLTVDASSGGFDAARATFVYEKRFGPRNQIEIAVPAASGGVGDVAFGVKRAIAHSLERGFIFAAAGEIILPTGDEREGLGKGTAIFEPFVSFGKILLRDSFVQAQVGAELPFDGDVADREVFWRVAAGRSFAEGQFGRTWTPIVEFIGSREMESAAPVHWDVVPQVQVTLNTRQHVMANIGLRVPLDERDVRRTEVVLYLLWDWFDGGLFDGW